MSEIIATLDARALEALYAVRDPMLIHALIWISELGRAWTIYGIGIVVALILLLRRHFAYATGLGVALITSGLGTLLTKGLVARARPPAEYQAYLEMWYSFPSAHTALAAALYGFLAYLAWSYAKSPVWRYIAILAAVGITGTVAFSRLYLGVHYASDVLAGLALGGFSAWLGALIVRAIQRTDS